MASILTNVVLFSLGLSLLLLGGEALVRGSASLAVRIGVSPLVVGITVVGFGTSTPELVTSVEAALLSAPGIALGNIVGSNIANILLILGAAALATPVWVNRDMLRHALGVAVTAILLAGLAWAGLLNRSAGVALLVALAAYLTVVARTERGAVAGVESGTDEIDAGQGRFGKWLASPPAMLFAVVAGLTMLIFGGRVLVDAAVALAGGLGVSQTVIGVTIVAIGTSLPEMAAAMIAARRGHPEIALGNILGSNIYNSLGIAGATVLVAPVAVPRELLRVEMPVMVAASILLLILAWIGIRLTRRGGGIMVATYLAFLTLIAVA